MRNIAIVAGLVCLVALAGCAAGPRPFARGPANETRGPKILLVNLSKDEAWILKNPRVEALKGEAFVCGIIADIGENRPSPVGCNVYLPLKDVYLMREFTREQAKEYYGAQFREKAD